MSTSREGASNVSQSGRRYPQSFRVYLCHRRQRGVSREHFQWAWTGEQARLMETHGKRLGCIRYEQVHMVRRTSPLFLGMLASRNYLSIAASALLTGRIPPRLEALCHEHFDREFDVVDELWFESRASLENAINTDAGREAALILGEHQRALVEATSVIVGTNYEVIPQDAAFPNAKVMFCLKRRHSDTREEMQQYWITKHGDLVRDQNRHVGALGYEQLHSRPEPAGAKIANALAWTLGEDFEGIANLIYPSIHNLYWKFLNPLNARIQKANAKLLEDEHNFVNGQQCVLVLGRANRVY